jgi:hypothetical protein
MLVWWVVIFLWLWRFAVPLWAQDVCFPQDTLNTTLQLAWTAAVPLPGMTILTYIVERQRDSEGWQVIITLPAMVTSLTDTGLAPGHTYWYRVHDTVQMSDGSTGISAYATNGMPPPCVTLALVPGPADLSATPQ